MAIYSEHTDDSVQWGVWELEESIEELLKLLPEAQALEKSGDSNSPTWQQFPSLKRQREWLAVRVLLYTLLRREVEIAYEPSGRPYLTDRSCFISISHTKGYVAVILSRVAEVGIDIEQYGLRIRKLAHKFMRADEVSMPYLGDDTWSLLLHWSAKEVLFKSMQATAVDFREHLHILPFAIGRQGVFTGCEYRTLKQETFQIHYHIYPDFVLTWQSSLPR